MIFDQNDNVEVVKIEAGDIKTEPIDPVTGKQRLLNVNLANHLLP